MCGSPSGDHVLLGKRLNRPQGRNPKGKTGITVSVARCKTCGLIYANPLPIPASLQDHYGIPPEEYWKESYFAADNEYFAYEISMLKKLYSFQPGDKALDIGAGLGKAMISLAHAGFDTYGFEPSKPFYDRAITQMKLDPNRLKLSSLEEASYPENSFDFVTFGAVLEHLYDPSSAIVKAMTWLKPGGLLHIEVPSSKWFIARLANFYYRLIGTDYVTNISPMHEPFHLYEFSPQSFFAHAKKHNYAVAHHEYYVAATYLPQILNWVAVPYMRLTQTGMQLCVWLRK